jgi:regulator of CtrA degradation
MLLVRQALRGCVGLLMSEKSAIDVELVSFGERLATSPVFATLFRDGMALVEETASYLDGPGRQESKKLPRAAALTYATESMRLTTRLMQLASWLLIRRAVSEGELTPEQAVEEQRKIKLPTVGGEAPSRELSHLPARLRELVEQSVKLQERVIRLDQMLGQHETLPPAEAGNPLKVQLSRLREAFGKEAE